MNTDPSPATASERAASPKASEPTAEQRSASPKKPEDDTGGGEAKGLVELHTHHNSCPRGEHCACYVTGYTDAEYDHGHVFESLDDKLTVVEKKTLSHRPTPVTASERPIWSDICSKCGEPAGDHGDFGFRDHAFRDARGKAWDIDWSNEPRLKTPNQMNTDQIAAEAAKPFIESLRRCGLSGTENEWHTVEDSAIAVIQSAIEKAIKEHDKEHFGAQNTVSFQQETITLRLGTIMDALEYHIKNKQTTFALTTIKSLRRLIKSAIEKALKECHKCDLPDSIKEALNSGDGTYRP